MKLESLVIADQHAAVNVFLSLYTPPVKPPKRGASEVAVAARQAPKMKPVMGTKSNKVTVGEPAVGSPPF